MWFADFFYHQRKILSPAFALKKYDPQWGSLIVHPQGNSPSQVWKAVILHKKDGLCLGFTSFVSMSWDSIPLETATSSYSGWRWSPGFGWSCWACCPWPTGTEIEETPLMLGSLFLGLGFVCKRFESTKKRRLKTNKSMVHSPKLVKLHHYVCLQSVAMV